MVSPSYGQILRKKDVKGEYERSTGDPARTIQKNDSSFISIPYMEYSREILKLKRFGRLSLTYNSSVEGIGHTVKGKWKLEGEIIILYIDEEELKYKFKPPVYLESIEGKRGYSKNI